MLIEEVGGTKPETMFKYFLKIAFRNFVKNKSFSLINISGLAVGVSVFLMIMLYVRFEKSYDKYHHNIDGLYRVVMSSNLGAANFASSATNHPAVGPAMKADFPEVKAYARLVDESIFINSAAVSYAAENGSKVTFNEENMYIADGAIFKMFDIPILAGDRENPLREPRSMAISESVAFKYFGEEDPIGKFLTVNSNTRMKVAAVFEDLPTNTHLKFELLLSFQLFEGNLDNTWIWPEFYNYIQLEDGTDPKAVEAKFPQMVVKYLSQIMEEYNFETRFKLQPVADIHLTSNLAKELKPNSSHQTINFLVILAFFIILIALVNYINLSTAKSVERAREVGLRKVIGTHRVNLIAQFLLESILINFFALLVAMVLVVMLFPYFNGLVGLDIISIDFWKDVWVWQMMAMLLLTGGIMAGIYPAFVLSSFRPAEVLKGKFHHSGSGNAVKKGLIVFQLSVSIALILGTVVVYSQLTFMRAKDPGYDTSQSLVLRAPAESDSTYASRIRTFNHELRNHSSIENVSISSDVPGKPLLNLNTIRNDGQLNNESEVAHYLTIDEEFIGLYDMEMKAGENFSRGDEFRYDAENERNAVLVNETALKILGIANAEEAVGAKVHFKLGPIYRPARIKGVVGDFHQQSLQKKIEPILFIYNEGGYGRFITLKTSAGNLNAAMSHLQEVYPDFFPNDALEYFFLDEYFDRQYTLDQRLVKIFMSFSVLAIFIASLGLFGLASYVALHKAKEMGIRKILGASVQGIILLMSMEFVKLVLLAAVVSIPLAYFGIKEWLDNYAFQLDLEVWMFLVPVAMVLVITLFTIGIESLKTALMNPVNTLRNE